MKISLNLLSTALRKEWMEVPAHPLLRSRGVGRVKVQEIAGDVFDELWDDVILTEREVLKLEEQTSRSKEELRRARQAKKAARAAMVEACVIDHDAESFASEVPKVKPTSPQGKALIERLTQLGFTTSEATTALEVGEARKPFSKAECAHFYERCQPDGLFMESLLVFIKRFQECDDFTPERYWNIKGAPPLVSPKADNKRGNPDPLAKRKEPPP